MAKTYYFPLDIMGRVLWLKNFNVKFPSYASLLGFTALDVTLVGNDTAAYIYAVDIAEIFRTEARERISYRDVLGGGQLGTVLGAFPLLPALPVAPVAVPAGIFQRIASLVKRIKAHPQYTLAIGQDLGIIGTEMIEDLVTPQPTLELVKTSGIIQVKYVRGKHDGILLYSKRGDETDFTLLDKVNKPSYRDARHNLVPNRPEKREYMAWYFIDDERVGQPSQQASVVI